MIRKSSLNKVSAWTGAVLLLFLSAVAGAEIKVGFVNVARLLEESPQAQAAMQALQDEFAPRQREIVSHQQTVSTLEESLRRDGAVMSEDERRTVERDLRDAQRELGRLQNEYVEDLNLRRNEELGQLQRSLLTEVQEYARDSGYDLIVGDGVLFASDVLDVTQQVLVSLRSRYERETAATDGGD